jgi:hypothetical protein
MIGLTSNIQNQEKLITMQNAIENPKAKLIIFKGDLINYVNNSLEEKLESYAKLTGREFLTSKQLSNNITEKPAIIHIKTYHNTKEIIEKFKQNPNVLFIKSDGSYEEEDGIFLKEYAQEICL